MPGQIIVRGLKHVKSLKFNIPEKGVHLLAGVNGAGKTTVLACLRRIEYANAFAFHFPGSVHQTLDDFTGASVAYAIGAHTVTYTYRGERWVPRPKTHDVFKQFGYPSILYVGATAERITPRGEDFNPRKVRPAPPVIQEAANRIFSETKFKALKIINLTSGPSNKAYVLQTGTAGNFRYYSEKNFSLGELCILKLVRLLDSCPHNSLVLIDELELALHPKAQVELFSYLKDIAAIKNLTVIFSTHSVTLLKSAHRKEIIFLESDGGAITTLNPCYPSYALGNIAHKEESIPDIVVYVEDENARCITEAIIKLWKNEEFSGNSLPPTTRVTAIGTFMDVVRFLARSDALIPPPTKSSVLLDLDVKDETLAEWRRTQNHAMLGLFHNNQGRISYLPHTPEVGLIEFFRDHARSANKLLSEEFQIPGLSVDSVHLVNIPAAPARPPRKASKAAVQAIVEEFIQRTNRDEIYVRRTIFEMFAKHYYNAHKLAMKALLGPILRQ